MQSYRTLHPRLYSSTRIPDVRVISIFYENNAVVLRRNGAFLMRVRAYIYFFSCREMAREKYFSDDERERERESAHVLL